MALITPTEVRALAIQNAGFDINLIKDNQIEQAQIDHLKPILSDNLYYALVATPASYAALLSGETFTNTEGFTVVYRGLKNFIAYATVYSCMKFWFAQGGASGLVRANSDSSTNTTETEFDKQRNMYFKQFNSMIAEIEDYLQEKYTSSTLYAGSQTKKFIGGMLL